MPDLVLDSPAALAASGVGGLPAAPLSVLVVDDHEVFNGLMTYTLLGMAKVNAVVTASNVHEARAAIAGDSFDVAILDVQLPDGSGLDLVSEVTASGARAILLTGHPRRSEAARAAELGASGYLAKDGSLAALTAALANATPVRPHLAERFPEDSLAGGTLTDREREVLMRIVDGQDATWIAGDLTVSVLTVRSHIKSLLAKLGVRSQLEAVALASQAGLSAQRKR